MLKSFISHSDHPENILKKNQDELKKDGP